MENNTIKRLALVAIFLTSFYVKTDCYSDVLDPDGNITIKWDINSWTPDGYMATVTIFNWHKYRHISAPGWILGWEWAKKEVIRDMVGAQTSSQGDCSAYGNPIPHCCAPNPSVVDLLPGVPYNQQVPNCCKGGVLSSYAQDPEAASSSFQITVGNSGRSSTTVALPVNFTLNTPGPGYSCGHAKKVPPSKFPTKDNRRVTQAFMTWNVTCTYSQYVAQRVPNCCVSLSSFYNATIIPCVECACSCGSNSAVDAFSKVADQSTNTCIDPRTLYDALPTSSFAKPPASSEPDILYCTRDMCPVKIHWHVKANYREYWRVRVTITNRDFSRNFTAWTLTLKHPNFANFTEAFSFNHKISNPYGIYENDTAAFWGIKYYNDMLMHAGPSGNVQSEILFGKGKDFKFTNGWAFPSRVYFNGDACVLPEAQDYPTLPNSSPRLQMSIPSIVSIVAAIGLSLLQVSDNLNL